MHETRATFETMSVRARRGLALSCIALGVYPVLLAAGVVDAEPDRLDAPRWAIGLAGALFVGLGIFLTLRHSAARGARSGED